MNVLIVTNMYPKPERPAFGTFVKEQVDSLKEAGIQVDVFDFDGSGGAGQYLKVAGRLGRTLQDKRYDLIHAHYGLTGMVARLQTGCPIVITFHGSDLMGTVDSHFRYTVSGTVVSHISKIAGLMATKCIVVAETLKSKLWLKSAVTIPMGVDISLFVPMPQNEARAQLGLTSNNRRVLFVANPKNLIKRFDIAKAAVQLLKQDGLDVELLPIYDVPHHQIPKYMNACDVLALTSMHEASPCVVKEAMACNLPIVSADVGDVAERIAGVDGCYLCERTPQDVAIKLRRVLESNFQPDCRSKIIELSLQNIAQRVITVYEQVLGTRS